MPPVVIGAVLVGAVAGVVAGSIATGLIVAGVSLGLSLVSQALAPDIEGFSVAVRDRSITARTTAEPKTLVIGELALGGQMALFEATGATKEFLHVVVAHADHPCDAIDGWFVNNDPAGNQDTNGNVTDGRFSGHLRLVPNLGALDQAAAPNLVTEVANWTEDHKGGGVTYTEARLKWSADVWPNGFTGIRAQVRGMPMYDPRDAGVAITASDLATPAVFTTGAVHGRSVGDQVWIKNHIGAIQTVGGQPIRFTGKWHQVASVPTTSTMTLIDLDGQPVNFTTAGTGGTVTPMVWSDNWALAVRMYITHRASYDAQDDEIDDATVIASANISDEQVALTPEAQDFVVESATFTPVDVPGDEFTLSGQPAWPTAHPVRTSTTGTLPAGLSPATVYFAIPTDIIVTIAPFGFPIEISRTRGLKLAATAADAEAGTAITVTSAGTGTHTLTDADDRVILTQARSWRIGDGIALTTSGTLPAGLATATTYFAIRVDSRTYRLATTLENARARTAIVITDAGTGVHTATRDSQLRYTANGVIQLGNDPHRPLDELMTAAAGTVVTEAGTIRIYAGAATTASGTTDESDMRDADLDVVPFLDRQNVFNAARGTFVDPDKHWTEGDAPPVQNALYRSEDNGELIFRDFQFPFTTDPVMAQRLLKIALERARQGATLKFPAKPSKYGTAVWDVETVTIDHLGYAAKEFRVMGWAEQEDFGIDILYREEAAAVWDWNLGDENTIDLAPNSNLPDALDVKPPTALKVTEELYITRNGAGVKARAIVEWTAAADVFVTDGGGYDVRYRLVGAPMFIVEPADDDIRHEIDDIAPGVYEFQVRSVNSLGIHGDYVAIVEEITGLLTPPAEPQNMTISALGGLAIIRWTQSADLDVRIGGVIVFRHSPLTAGATWSGSVKIGDEIAGSETVAVLPLKPGSYLAKARDSSREFSIAAAVVTTKQATVIDYTNVGQAAEHPTFTGPKTNVVATGGILKLDGATLIDTWGLIDDVVQWDAEGGIFASGIYDFAGSFDFTTVVRRRLTAGITAQVVLATDFIDNRALPIDSWEDFDGAAAASADASVWVRETDDDPAGSPTWSAWQRLDSAEYQARAFDFQARLTSDDPAYNIEISVLTVDADRIT